MTIVATWLNKESGVPRLWSVSDSRLSLPSSVFDFGAKLFSIRLSCLEAGPDGFINKVHFTNTIGFSFAGSSLMGLNLHALLSHFLGNLTSPTQQREIPSMEDVANFAKNLIEHLIQEHQMTMLQGTPPVCEVAISGYCVKKSEFQVFHLSPVPGIGPIQVNVSKIDFSDDQTVHLLGDHKLEIANLIEEARLTLLEKNIKWWRAPQNVIERVIKDKVFSTIGGDLQLGFTTHFGFQLVSLCRPIEEGKPASTFFHQNIDVGSPKFNTIGPCMLNIMAMA